MNKTTKVGIFDCVKFFKELYSNIKGDIQFYPDGTFSTFGGSPVIKCTGELFVNNIFTTWAFGKSVNIPYSKLIEIKKILKKELVGIETTNEYFTFNINRDGNTQEIRIDVNNEAKVSNDFEVLTRIPDDEIFIEDKEGMLNVYWNDKRIETILKSSITTPKNYNKINVYIQESTENDYSYVSLEFISKFIKLNLITRNIIF